MQITAPLGIFGGTFDPIHNGHILPIVEGAAITEIKSITLMPCYIPNHKNAATASSQDRLEMVKLVCQDFPIFHPDNRDIIRAKPTVSLDSLRELRHENPHTPLCFFIGSDSLQNLPKWYKYQELFSLCHFVVCTRQSDLMASPHEEANNELRVLLQQRQTKDTSNLHNKLAGHIYLANTQPLTMSSSYIRTRLTKGQSIEHFVPSKVFDYIQQHKLYQPRVEI